MPQIWDVAIVGGGPVGVFAANLLAQSGLHVRVIERETAPYSLPRAVHVDHEMLRLFSGIGLLERLKPKMRAGDGHIHIGADQGVIRFLSAAGKSRPFGYANDYFFYQPELESILRTGLSRFKTVQLDLGIAVDSISQTHEAVTLGLDDGTECSARWVIGCDGARSFVRKGLGVQLEDLKFEEPWLVVDAKVDGPIVFPTYKGLPDGTNLQNLSLMRCDPKRPATIVPGRGNHRRWEFMLLPGENDTEMAETARVAAMIKEWVGDSPHEIIRAATYRFHGLVAEHWRIGRVFLAGDSAHQTPPFFGQGLCHGLRDAANLAWKLKLVTDGSAKEALLDTYQIERDAQVRHVIGKAVEAGRYICELDPEKAAVRDARIRSETGIKTAAELIAPLASKIVFNGAGERFINPPMANEKLLDDITGGGWRLFATTLKAPTHPVLDVLSARPCLIADHPDAEGHLARWFASHNATYALVRPDHYVALIAHDQNELMSLLDCLGKSAALALPEPV